MPEYEITIVTTFRKKVYAYATSESHAIEQIRDALSWGIDGTLSAEKTVSLEDVKEADNA